MPTYTNQATGQKISSETELTSEQLEEAFGLAKEPGPKEEEKGISEYLPTWKDVPKYGLMTAGAAGGMALGGPPGAVLGAGLGYAGGKSLEPIIEKKLVPLEKALTSLPGDILSGMQMEMGGQALGPVIGKVGEKLSGGARRLYESTLKAPPGSIPLAQREAAVTAGIESGIAPTQRGLKKLQGELDSINNEIQRIISSSSKSGQPISMVDVLKRTDELKKSYASLPPGRSQQFLDDILQVESQYMTQPSLTIKEAQEMKRKIYEIHRKHYGELKSAEVEAEKQIARGLKEEIKKQVPEIASLNERDSARIALENIVERAVKRTRNWDILGLTDLVGGSIGGTIGGASTGDWRRGGEGAALGLMVTRALREPAVASRLAFALSKAKVIKGTKAGRPISYAVTPEVETEE